MNKTIKRKIKKELRKISSSSNIDDKLFSLYEDKFRGTISEDDYVSAVKSFIAVKIQYTTGAENLKWKECKFPFKSFIFNVTDNTGKKTIAATAITLSEPFLGTPLPNRNGKFYPPEEVKKALDRFVGVDISSKDSDKTACLVLSPRMIGDKIVSYSLVPGPYSRAHPVARGREISIERMARDGFRIGRCFRDDNQIMYRTNDVKVELNNKNELIATEYRKIKVPSYVNDLPKEERIKYYEEYLGLEFKEEK